MARTAPDLFKKKNLKRLTNKMGGRQDKAFKQGPMLPDAGMLADTTDDEIDRLQKLLGSESLAKKVHRLAQQYPVATIPELVVYEWLERSGYPFEFQLWLYGGRRAPSGQGLVPDFVVSPGGSPIVWQVQGEYWHSIQRKGDRDKSANLRMLAASIRGRKVSAVVELWEDDIYNRRPQIFQSALQGVGLRA